MVDGTSFFHHPDSASQASQSTSQAPQMPSQISRSSLTTQNGSKSFRATRKGTHAGKWRKFRSCQVNNPWEAHTWKIFLASSLIVIPMVAFTITILWVVFANKLHQAGCPYPELCPGPDVVNITSPSHYYIDFSATQLAFISSWSSTVSFMLISAFMTIFGYSIAKTFLSSSTSPVEPNALPAPYQLSVMIRLLNADLLYLWELGLQTIKSVFWNKEKSHTSKQEYRTPITLRAGISIFVVCVIGSILIQAADTYLHLTSKAVNIVLTEPLSSSNFDYSRGLASWCLNRPTGRSYNNTNFWGCGINYYDSGSRVRVANQSAINDVDYNTPGGPHLFEYQSDKDASQYAIIGPAAVTSDIDWKASSFAVSTQCSPIPAAACSLGNQLAAYGDSLWPFNCSSKRGGINIEGNFTNLIGQQHFLDAHKYLQESQPFSDQPKSWNSSIQKFAANVTVNEINSTFRNPWNWVSVVILPDIENLGTVEGVRWLADPHIITDGTEKSLLRLILHCNTTVWDVTYTAVNGHVTGIEPQKSNGSIAGISSLPSFRHMVFLSRRFGDVIDEALRAGGESLEEFIKAYEITSSKLLVRPIVAQTSNRPSLLVQKRRSRLLTRLPVVSLWFLVVANLLYAVLGLCLAGWAFVNTSPSIHQVYTRLSISGLVAELFEKPFSKRVVKRDLDLFEDGDGRKPERGVKNVGVRMTDAGGSELFLTAAKAI